MHQCRLNLDLDWLWCPEQVARCCMELAGCYIRTRQIDLAEKHGRRAVESFGRLVGPHDVETIAAIVLQGLSGQLKVAGKSFGAEAMTPFGPALKDEEIAAVITFVRNEWGNSPDNALEPKAMIQLITDTRKKIQSSGHTGAWTKELLDANEFTTPEE